MARLSGLCPSLRGTIQVGVLRCLAGCPTKAPHHRCTASSLAERWREYTTDADTTKKMTFEEYRKLKKSLKMRSRLAGIPLGFGGVILSSFVNVQLNPHMFEMTPEEVQPILGMDPIMLAALCGVTSGIVGYFMGGALFTATWKLIARNQYKELQQRDVDFLERLQKYRFSDVNKYEDDYYGDKVVTLSDYRQWIRQQQKRKESFQAAQAAQSAKEKT